MFREMALRKKKQSLILSSKEIHSFDTFSSSLNRLLECEGSIKLRCEYLPEEITKKRWTLDIPKLI